eukprot:3124347-Pyramimonas_sp.AAC.1
MGQLLESADARPQAHVEGKDEEAKRVAQITGRGSKVGQANEIITISHIKQTSRHTEPAQHRQLPLQHINPAR